MGTTPLERLLWWAYAGVYDGLLDFHPYRHLVATVIDRLQLVDGLRLLDVGCGTGNVMSAALARAAVEVQGIDGEPAMVARARRKLAARLSPRPATANVTCGDAVASLRGLPDRSVDRICLVNVLYAVADRGAVWRECLRLLAPGGLVVATTSTRAGTMPLVREHLRHASRWQLASPRLVGVCVVDGVICGLARAGRFAFPPEEVLLAEVVAAGGVPSEVGRIYGGDTDGVNVIFTVRRAT